MAIISLLNLCLIFYAYHTNYQINTQAYLIIGYISDHVMHAHLNMFEISI